MRKQFDLEYYLAHPETRVVTRDNRSVRIICTDAESTEGYHVVGLLFDKYDDYEMPYRFTDAGEFFKNGKSSSDLFFDLPDPVKKKVALTCEDLQERVNAGKTMWIVIDTTDINKVYTRYISNFGCNGVYYVFEFEIMFLSYQKLIEYQIHFVDGTPCWKEVEE